MQNKTTPGRKEFQATARRFFIAWADPDQPGMRNPRFITPPGFSFHDKNKRWAPLFSHETAAREAGRVRAELEKKGQRIGAMNTLIAAHAKSLGLPVVTNNVADFLRVRGVKVENWS